VSERIATVAVCLFVLYIIDHDLWIMAVAFCAFFLIISAFLGIVDGIVRAWRERR